MAVTGATVVGVTGDVGVAFARAAVEPTADTGALAAEAHPVVPLTGLITGPAVLLVGDDVDAGPGRAYQATGFSLQTGGAGVRGEVGQIEFWLGIGHALGDTIGRATFVATRALRVVLTGLLEGRVIESTATEAQPGDGGAG